MRPLLLLLPTLSLVAGWTSPATAQCRIFESSKLVASDAARDERFGRSVAVSDNWMLVGAVNERQAETGAVYFFEWDGRSWVERQKVLSPDTEDGFGSTVDIDGDVAFAAAPSYFLGTGRLHVYRLRQGQWHYAESLFASDGDAFDGFGQSLSVDGSIALVTAPGNHAVYQFEDLGGRWKETQRLQFDDGFGRSVSLDGERAVVGVTGLDDGSVPDAGGAFILERRNERWRFVQEILGPSGRGLEAGSAVAICGDVVAVASPRFDGKRGAVRLARFDGSTWVIEEDVQPDGLPSDAGFGHALALSHDRLIASSGDLERVHEFQATPSGWSEWRTFVPHDADRDGFGQSLGLDGDVLAVGAPGAAQGGTEAGGVFTAFVPPLGLYGFVTDGTSLQLDLSICRGAPFSLMTLAVTEFQGTPQFIRLLTTPLDSGGAWARPFTLPDTLRGTQWGLTAFGFPPFGGAPVATNVVLVDIPR